MNQNTQCRICRRAPAVSPSPFCKEHEAAWKESPENRRAIALDSPEVRISALADFATRIRGEADDARAEVALNS